MVFKRRERRPFLRKMQDAVYPRRGWRRAIEYIGHRIKRLPDTPHKISLGFAIGVFISFSPLFGMHFLFAALLAMAVRGNVLASLMGTFFGNPITFPFIATISYRTGQLFLDASASDASFNGIKLAIVSGFVGTWQSILSIVGMSEPAWGQVAYFFRAVFVPYLIGGILPGVLCGVVCYIIARPLVAAYQKSRRNRLLKRSQKKRTTIAQTAADPAE